MANMDKHSLGQTFFAMQERINTKKKLIQDNFVRSCRFVVYRKRVAIGNCNEIRAGILVHFDQ